MGHGAKCTVIEWPDGTYEGGVFKLGQFIPTLADWGMQANGARFVVHYKTKPDVVCFVYEMQLWMEKDNDCVLHPENGRYQRLLRERAQMLLDMPQVEACAT